MDTWRRIHRQFASRPRGVALVAEGRSYTYERLLASVGRLAETLSRRGLAGRGRRLAVFSTQTPESYCGVLAAGWTGGAYLPLDPNWPDRRLARVLADAAPSALLLDAPGRRRLAAASPAARRLPQIWIGDAFAGRPPAPPPPAPRTAADPAYLIYTSGTSGTPKGVVVTMGNLESFLRAARETLPLTPGERVSQCFPLTFDLSVLHLFAAWSAGAALCVVPEAEKVLPVGFIRGRRLDVWFSTPSAGALTAQSHTLRPGCLPRLRRVLFCGEPLPRSVAAAWSRAAPAASVVNLYGPTETTVACLQHRWNPAEPDDVVPIGRPLPGVKARIRGLGRGARQGELLIAGDQVSPGYWKDASLTRRRFIRLGGSRRTWYRTGDKVEKSRDGVYRFLGRLDRQTKVLGHRVELGEVERALRKACGSPLCAVWPVSGADGLVRKLAAAFVGRPARVSAVREALRQVLPAYAVPRKLTALPRASLTAGGKLNVRALRAGVTHAP